MNEESRGFFSCKGTSWIAAALLGFVAYLILRARYDMSFIIALVFGLVLAVLISWALRQYFCAEVAETEGGFAARSAARAEDRRQFEADRAEAKAAAAEAKAEAAAEKDATQTPAPEGQPPRLQAPRDGGADDLKMIKGIGPKLEKMLNSMGFYHFDQIASWGEDEVAWMDENLEGFKGRVSRDEWVEQARVLAAGGTTEFAAKVKKGDVYD